MVRNYKITVVGLGYVGLSNAILFAHYFDVIAFDIDKSKTQMIRKKKSPFKDQEIENYLRNENLRLHLEDTALNTFNDANYVIIATPTNYDEETKEFDTSSVESIISTVVQYNKEAVIIIKSTIPIGFTQSMNKKYETNRILFCPEFLREGRALFDTLNPSRIIIGGDEEYAKEVQDLFSFCYAKQECITKITTSAEAESIKLFSNTYLAMRISFFNELDTFAEEWNLDTKTLIEGICLDERIGSKYNNPSFGYGGYCLPKDTKQLSSNYGNLPHPLIESITDSNQLRKMNIVNKIITKKPKVLGIYRLVMKSESDNFRSAAMKDIIEVLLDNGITIIVYEPIITKSNDTRYTVENNLKFFKMKADLIVANRFHDELEDVKDKVYTRDVFGNN